MNHSIHLHQTCVESNPKNTHNHLSDIKDWRVRLIIKTVVSTMFSSLYTARLLCASSMSNADPNIKTYSRGRIVRPAVGNPTTFEIQLKTLSFINSFKIPCWLIAKAVKWLLVAKKNCCIIFVWLVLVLATSWRRSHIPASSSSWPGCCTSFGMPWTRPPCSCTSEPTALSLSWSNVILSQNWSCC